MVRGSSGTYNYDWSMVEQTPLQGTIDGNKYTPVISELGKEITCTVTKNGMSGSLTKSETVYMVEISLNGNEDADAASITDKFVRDGDVIKIIYTVGTSGTKTNFVEFTGGVFTQSIDANSINCRINAEDAIDGKILLTVYFKHLNFSPVISVSAGTQTGTLTAGTAGSVKFTVITEYIADETYTVTLNSSLTGVSAENITINENEGTLTLNTNASTPQGTHQLTLTIDGVTSDSFELIVNAAPPPAKHDLIIQAGTGGSVTTGANGQHESNAVINIAASANNNYIFSHWSASNGGTFANENSATTNTLDADLLITKGLPICREPRSNAFISAPRSSESGTQPSPTQRQLPAQ